MRRCGASGRSLSQESARPHPSIIDGRAARPAAPRASPSMARSVASTDRCTARSGGSALPGQQVRGCSTSRKTTSLRLERAAGQQVERVRGVAGQDRRRRLRGRRRTRNRSSSGTAPAPRWTPGTRTRPRGGRSRSRAAPGDPRVHAAPARGRWRRARWSTDDRPAGDERRLQVRPTTGSSGSAPGQRWPAPGRSRGGRRAGRAGVRRTQRAPEGQGPPAASPRCAGTTPTPGPHPGHPAAEELAASRGLTLAHVDLGRRYRRLATRSSAPPAHVSACRDASGHQLTPAEPTRQGPFPPAPSAASPAAHPPARHFLADISICAVKSAIEAAHVPRASPEGGKELHAVQWVPVVAGVDEARLPSA